jgi:HK97 family phage major capsid protein
MPKIETETPTVDPKASRLVELRQRLVDLDASLLELADKGERVALTEDDETRWEALTTERDMIAPEVRKLEERAARIAEIRTTTTRRIQGLPDPVRKSEILFGQDVRTLDWRQARDGALSLLEDRDVSGSLSPHQIDVLDRQFRDPRRTELARRALVTENDAYKSAFHKYMTRGNIVLTDEERVAMLRYEEYRAAAEGTTTLGGFAIPVFIDPSVILTDQETENPFLAYARTVDVNTNAWKGISAAGVSWSFDSEGTAVSDDSITIAQPSVTVFMARGFIPYSIEIGEDWPGFQAEMGRLLGIGYDELLISKFTSGNGTSEPRGIVTALLATGASQVVSTTDGTFGYPDIYSVWKALPQKYRRRAAWMMSVGINNLVRQFGAANVYHAATVALPAGAAEVLFNRPVLENPYMPDFTGTTGAEARAVVGDFSNYVIARRQGMNVELVPQLFDVTNNRPTGQRGWFAYARIGGNSVNDAGFRLLLNT